MDIETPIQNLPKIGPFYRSRLNYLGIKTIRDLLYHFPARYEDFSARINIANLKVGEQACIQGIVENVKLVRIFKRHMTIVEAQIADASGKVRATWFNQPYLAGTFKKGMTLCLAGKLAQKNGRCYLSNPVYEIVRDNFGNENSLTHTGRLVPIYPETAGVSSRWLRYIIKPLLSAFSKTCDPLPINTLNAYELMPWSEALNQIHFPQSLEAAESARKRFAFEELFFIQLSVLRERIRLNSEKAAPIPLNSDLIKKFTASLPFKLTQAQRVAAFRILKDMEKTRPTNRLLQGDVGSGKTIVAMMAALNCAKAGHQTAFMAPTEILANQHYETLSNLLKPFGVEIGILCSKHTAVSSYGAVKSRRFWIW